MRVAITNLGCLPSVEIDLSKDLILFTGPNNTSKTYAATLIYGLLRGRWLDDLKIEGDDPALQALQRGSHEETTSFPFGSALIAAGIRGAVEGHGEHFTETGWIREQFAGGATTFTQARIALRLEDADQEKLRLYAQHGGTFASDAQDVFFSTDGEEAIFESAPQSAAPDALSSALRGLYAYLLRRVLGPAVILPAERSAIQLFSKELLLGRSSLAAGNPKLQALQRSIPRYPVPIRDCLEITGDLQNLQKRTGPFAYLADELEQQILRGAVRASLEGSLTFTPEGTAPSLDLHLSSSSVKSLSLLSFYLRHLLDPGDWLIIDEPELNLHPDNQRLVARLLARLVRAGVRVLCSTHSDIVIREINNLIMLSSDVNGALREELGYAADESLPAERVGAYLFLGNGAEALPVEPNGFAVRTIDREINRMNNTSERIYQSLFVHPPEE